MRRLMPFAVVCTLAATLASNAFAWGGAPDWLKELARQPLPTYPSETKGVALLDEAITTVDATGEVHTLYRRAYKILGTSGRDLGYTAVYFDNDTKISNWRAWSITPSGEEYQVKDHDSVESAAFDGSLYADTRMKVLQIPAAEPGSIVAVEYEQRERPHALQDMWYVQHSVPVRTTRYTLNLPAGWGHEERWFNGAAVAPTTAGNSLVWEIKDVPGVKEELAMPPFKAVARRMGINFLPPQNGAPNSHRTWDDVGHWSASLFANRRTATPAITAKVQELTASQSDPLERIRALAAFVQRDVRYVAIEIGIGGFQPHLAGEIFQNHYGDCKDKVTVLGAMLHEIGVPSYYVMVNTTRDVVDRDFASPGSFDHAIIAIRLPDAVKPTGLHSMVTAPRLGKLLIFDPTNENTPLGLLPEYLQAGRGLIVGDDGTADLVELPVVPPDANRLAVTARMTLAGDGALDGTVAEVRTGTIAAGMRNTLRAKTEAERKQYFEKRTSRSVTQSVLRDLTFENLDDMSKDLVVRYHLTVPSYAKHASALMLVRPRLLGRKAEGIVDLKERKYDYATEGPSLETDDVEIKLPAGLVADELPAAQQLASGGFSYVSASKMEGGALEYKREYRVEKFSVPVAGLPELNKFLARILADERSSAVLKAQ